MPCTALAIDADPPALVESVQSAFTSRSDIDRCAHVTLRARRAAVVITVELPDGRVATRVARETELIATLEALLVVVPAPEPPREALVEPPPSPAAIELPVIIVPVLPGHAAEAGLSKPHPSRGVGIEASIETGGRAALDHRGALGVGASIDLDVHGWLIGVRGRVDQYTSLTSSGPGQIALGVGPVAGGRLRFSSLSLDLTIAPKLVYLGTTTEMLESPGHRMIVTTSPTVPRIQLAGRLNFRADALIRPFVSFDVELGPGGADLFPSGTAGFSFGAAIGS